MLGAAGSIVEGKPPRGGARQPRRGVTRVREARRGGPERRSSLNSVERPKYA